VLGLIQVGEQAMADRYTYLPLIGPVVALVWYVAEVTGRFSFRRQLMVGCGLPTLIVCVVLTRQQLSYWRDTITLFEQTLKVTTANPSANFALGTGLEKTGEVERAVLQYQAAVAIDPTYKKAHYNLGQLFKQQQQWSAAANHYRAVFQSDPNDVPSHLNLASVLSAQGLTREALSHYDEALRLDPNSLEALNNAAWILATAASPESRDGAKAVWFGLRACELSSNSIPTMIGTLAAAYAEVGQFTEAIATGERARELATAHGQIELARKNEELVELFRAGKPYRELTP
jgi:tetratricopeptide (TPR) repeat protein